MVYDYLVSVKNEKGKYVDILSQLLCFISAIFFVLEPIKSSRVLHFDILFVIAGVLVGGLVYLRYLSTTGNRIVSYGRLLALAGFTWLTMPFLRWLAIPFILLALIEKHAKSPLEIGVSGDRVVFNSLIKRTFAWNALSNVLMKDGLLTLDFKNNRLFQKEIEGDTSANVEAEFNEYCRNHLATASTELT